VLAYAAFLFATIVLPLGATVAGIRALRRGAEPPALPRKGEFGQISTVLEELRDATQRVRDLAFFDSLTGLSSRARFEQALGEALAKSKRNPGALTVVLIELHRLREIASAYGPAVVERCLRAAGERALFAVPAAHTPSRYGESRLAYLVAGGEPEGVTTEARGILEALRAPLAIDGLMLQLEAHAGVARHPQDGADVPALLAAAETALVSARGRRPGEVAAFDPAISETFRRDFALLQDLERGLGHGEIVPYFHPIIDCGRGEACAAEALARWQHPTRGLLAPASFLPLAERTGQIVVIDGHVLERAIEQQVQWRAAGLRVRIAVNLSPRYLAAAMVTRVEHALRRHHAHAADLVTELTETAVIAHGDDTDHVIRGLHALGATICLDDFGTGYSSLSYVRRLPIGQIKIDRSFVAEIGRSPAAERIIEATLTLARSIDIEVIAEGVETREQMLWLMRRGCMLQQGYLFARPQPAAEFATWLEGSSVELLALLGMGRALQA
jgi:diguanylate cyclase (GGDEF)-like protein